MLRTGIFFFTLFLLGGCSGNYSETLFEKDGISFISPAGWTISDIGDINETGSYISCQRKGYGSSGIFMLSWINAIMDANIYIKNYRNEIEKNFLMKVGRVEFTEPSATFFNDIPCLYSTYTAVVLGVESMGEIYSFSTAGKTFMLVFQESLDESEKNKAGFEKIKLSFRCNSDKSLSEKI